jgi:hypothetical protein
MLALAVVSIGAGWLAVDGVLHPDEHARVARQVVLHRPAPPPIAIDPLPEPELLAEPAARPAAVVAPVGKPTRAWKPLSRPALQQKPPAAPLASSAGAAAAQAPAAELPLETNPYQLAR